VREPERQRAREQRDEAQGAPDHAPTIAQSRAARQLTRSRKRSIFRAVVANVYLAGISNSGPRHWQRLWYERDTRGVWVEQADWERPKREDWVAAIARELELLDEPAVLIGHSLGCLAAAEYLALHGASKVRAALLVAVPDVASPVFPAAVDGFRCPLTLRMTVPSLVVGSRNDPYASFEHARAVGSAWCSELYDVGALGHINADSGIGDWPEGLARWQQFERGALALSKAASG